MRSSQRSKLAAAVVFLLIAVAVVGGMAWATNSSFELAKRNVTELRERKISRAVWEMSNYMAGIIYSETARPWDDYRPVQERETVAIRTADGTEPDVQYAILFSPLTISGPPHSWIDLYFHVDGRGVFSPQVPEEATLSLIETAQFAAISHSVPEDFWAWLKTELPSIDLAEKVALSEASHVPSTVDPGSTERIRSELDAPAIASSQKADDLASREFQERQKSLREATRSYLPPADCVSAERNIKTISGTAPDGLGDETLQEFTTGPLTAFWLGTAPDGERRLAFVREGRAEDEVFYQGFVGKWEHLKPVLLSQIRRLLPDADLIPVSTDGMHSAEFSDRRMINLPVELQVPDVSGGASAAAWHRVRVPLIASWVAAAAVLIVAGIGLRNLVALTERRMQFAYAVTHELRTPLTTFRLYADMLSGGLVPPDSKQEYLDTLNRESIRLSNLVEEVLEFARLENQRVRLNPMDTDGASLLQVISETFVKRCQANGVEARTENGIADGQPLRTDVDIVNRIAGVLVNNACRHARGTERATVLVRLARENGTLLLDVIDSGPGVDRADLRSIFRPFRRGRAADKAARGGIGLGLALARGWATLLGGRLELASRHDPEYGGAHFRLSFPARANA